MANENEKITQIRIGTEANGTTYDIQDARVDNCLNRLNTLETNAMTYKVIGNYAGLARGIDTPDNPNNDWGWTRTTKDGLIPYDQSKAASLGTKTWQFKQAYAKDLYGILHIIDNDSQVKSGITGVIPIANGGSGTSKIVGNSNTWTAASGWAQSSSANSRSLDWGKIHYLSVYATRTGSALNGGTTGNIGDISIGTLSSSYRPAWTTSWHSCAGTTVCFGYVAATGVIKITNLLPGSTLANKGSVHFTTTWIA